MLLCTRCEQENPDGFRFCGACGAELAAPVTHAPEVRKTVTVLFCDLAGYTSAGERLDPEALRRIQSRYFEEARAALERHGGTVEKFIGDAVMAVFGIPQVHEDDALRALRAAVELREAVVVLGLEPRIGVNTGEVVAGSGDALVTGDAVNTAARLEQAAGPGEILIGEQTRLLARGAVEVEPSPPVVAKGKAAPIEAYRLVSVTEGAPAFERHLESPLVGRHRELEALRQAFERTASERACHLFTVLGPAGVGKSRLALELTESVGDRALVLSGRCLPYGEGITYWPLVEVFRAAGAEDELGVALSAAHAEETFRAVRKWLERIAAERPVVLVLDDLHWAEPTFLDLVDHIADWSRDAPILVLCMARPELLDARPAWAGGKLNATSVLLEPLSGDETAALIENLSSAVDEGLRGRIVEAAEGNPLYVEEMLAMLAEGGDAHGELEVPPTIQALLAARLDHLADAEREVVGRAAVEGRVFHRGAVAELTPADLRPDVPAHLQGLVRKELIRPETPDFPEEDAFRFRHLLIRDAAYDGLSKETRGELHEAFAGWLERMAGDHGWEYEEIVGWHLEQAHRYRVELGTLDQDVIGLGRRASRHLAVSGRRARARGDAPASASLLRRARDVLEPDDRERLELLPDLVASLVDAAAYEEANVVVRDGLSAAAELGDPPLEGMLSIEAAYLASHVDPGVNMTDILEQVERIIPVLEQADENRGLARAWTFFGLLTFWLGHADEALHAYERAYGHARRAGDRAAEADALWWRAATAYWGSTSAEDGIRLCEELLPRLSGHAYGGAFVTCLQACFAAMRGRFDEARRLRAEASAVLDELGLSTERAGTYQMEAAIDLLAGDAAAAAELLRRGCEFADRVGETGYLSTTAAVLAEALYRQGRDAEAFEATALSERTAAVDDFASQVGWRSIRAKVLARRGELEEAEALARAALTLVGGTDYIGMHGDTLLDLAVVLKAAGKSGEAAAAAGQALALYERKGNVVSARHVRAWLSELPS